MITYPSSINPLAILTPEKWGVTITLDKGYIHARLIFEGVENDNYFYRVAHLAGAGCVEISEPQPRERYRQMFVKKSPTYLASQDLVNHLINEIRKEQGHEVPFNMCGNKSIFSQPNEVYHIYDELLAAIKNQDPHLFICLCDSAGNQGKYTGMSQQKFNESIAQALLSINPHFPVGDFSYRDLVQLINTSVEYHSQYQDNCFTWARGKLTKIGAEISDDILEKILTLPRLYVTNNPSNELQAIECDANILFKTQRMQREPFYERFVTYDKDRDKRSEDWKILAQREDWKVLEKKITNTSLVKECSEISKLVINVSTLTLACVSAINPLVAGAVIVASTTLGYFARTSLEKKQEVLHEEFKILYRSSYGNT